MKGERDEGRKIKEVRARGRNQKKTGAIACRSVVPYVGEVEPEREKSFL